MFTQDFLWLMLSAFKTFNWKCGCSTQIGNLPFHISSLKMNGNYSDFQIHLLYVQWWHKIRKSLSGICWDCLPSFYTSLFYLDGIHRKLVQEGTFLPYFWKALLHGNYASEKKRGRGNKLPSWWVWCQAMQNWKSHLCHTYSINVTCCKINWHKASLQSTDTV